MGALPTGAASCTGPGSTTGSGSGIGAASGTGAASTAGSASGTGADSWTAGPACAASSSGTSHSQQSLHRPHFAHKWFAQVSFVHHTQMRVDSSPQIVQLNGMLLLLRLRSGVGLLGQDAAATLRFVIHHRAFLFVRGRQV